jgi:hypothetical protein
MSKSKKHLAYNIFIVLLAVILSGCTVTDHPRARLGSYAGSFASFTDANSLGHHNFRCFLGEHNGVAYTARGGHIDIAHLRIAADNVYYLNKKVSHHLQSGDTDFTYGLFTDTSVFAVHIDYPPDFKSLSKNERQRIIDEVSLEMAQYFTWQMVSWHEVLTWFGMTFYGFPQFNSAFSWEDNYSNLLGVILGAQAIRHPCGNFNDAMTMGLKDELVKLGVQPASIARQSSEKMRGKWYTDGMSVKVFMRNMDLGLDDGFVSPVLVPDICPEAQPLPYRIPKLESVARCGFNVDLYIKCSGSAGRRCLDIIYPDGQDGRVNPSVHLPLIMQVAMRQAVQKGFAVVPKTQESEFEQLASDPKLNKNKRTIAERRVP